MNAQIRRCGQEVGFYLFISFFCILTVSPSALFAGSIAGWGANGYGEATPRAGNNFIAIAAGDGDSFALKSDGSIVGWGYNGFGECNIPEGNNFIAIAAGFLHSLALKSDGSIVGWGYNRCGQINVPNGNNFIAIAAGQDHSLALKSDGSIIGWGDNSYLEVTPPAGNNFIAIAAGGCHSLALKSDGSIVGWGRNYDGEATPPTGNNFIAISAGGYHSLALKSDGSIVGWGAGKPGLSGHPNHGQLINIPAGNNFIAIAAGAYHSFALKSNGLIVAWGDNTYGQLNNIPAGNNFIVIAAGWYHSLALQQAPELTPPVANAGSDQTVMDADDNGSEQVTLDGSGSFDSDGTIVSWVWTDDLGDTIPDGEITAAALSVGIHTVTLTVTDDDGLVDANTVTVTVEPYPNQPPVANADGPYTIYVGDTLTLDASGSTDDDNNIVSYLWDLDDNNSFETDAGSQAVFDVNYTYLQSLGLLVNNTYNIRLKVTDSGGLSNVANSTLTIIPTPALKVFVDIKPGSCPNPLNVKSSGVLPVAILGTADFDVTTIDATSIRLAGVSPLRNSIEDAGRPAADSNDCNCIEDGPDGFLDLTLKFKTERIVEAIGDVNEGDVLTLELTGVLIGERPIEGADCVVVGSKHKPCNKFDINEDGVVDYSDFCEFAQNWMKSSIVEY